MNKLHFGTVWGIVGFAALLVQAIYRLGVLALEPILGGHMTGLHWGLYGVSIVFNAYAEGYRGFQLHAAPRVVARAFHLARDPRPLRVALAPIFCMGLFAATRKRLIVSWCLYVGIVVVVIAVRQLPQPWRGIVDAGVVVGLSWGLISVIRCFFRALAGHPMAVAPDLPESEVHGFEANPPSSSVM